MKRLALAFWLMLSAPLAAQEDYDALMDALARAETPVEAQALSAQVWQHWLVAPDEAAQAVLDAALERRRAYDFVGAIAHLDRLVEHYPDYAEGWNQRATVRFLRGELDASLADVEHVLALEPRHFGALSGKAMILYQQGKLPLAQIVIRQALRYHPFLNERVLLELKPGDDI